MERCVFDSRIVFAYMRRHAVFFDDWDSRLFSKIPNKPFHMNCILQHNQKIKSSPNIEKKRCYKALRRATT